MTAADRATVWRFDLAAAGRAIAVLVDAAMRRLSGRPAEGAGLQLGALELGVFESFLFRPEREAPADVRLRMGQHFGLRTVEAEALPKSPMLSVADRILLPEGALRARPGAPGWLPAGLWQLAVRLALADGRRLSWIEEFQRYQHGRFVKGASPPVLAPNTTAALWLLLALEIDEPDSAYLQLGSEAVASLKGLLKHVLPTLPADLPFPDQFLLCECARSAMLAGRALPIQLLNLPLATHPRYGAAAGDEAVGAVADCPDWLGRYLAQSETARS